MNPIKGFWQRSAVDGLFALLGCPIGHRLNNMTGPDVQACLQCPDGKYMQDPNDPDAICQQCPKSAQCPNKGPPIFDNSAVEGNLALDGDPNDLDAIIASLAATLGVDPASLVLGEISESSRRASLQIAFELFADQSELEALSAALSSPDLMDALAANLASQNITASVGVTSTVRLAEKREGEVWQQKNGVFVLTACPPGFLLINTTLETQECKECEQGTFLIFSEDGCQVPASNGNPDEWLGGCDNRACIACADGASCSKGSMETWRHFVPKALQLDGVVLPRVSVIVSGKTTRLFCDQESR